MLILSRKVSEAIIIGNSGIRVMVIAIKGKRVRLGIEAPTEVNIRREELKEIKTNGQT